MSVIDNMDSIVTVTLDTPFSSDASANIVA